ncbi:hypothetical protein EHQ68_09140 [Leptospira congkakensis]|uniref:Uncharacterized protein n=1 Tax=Leptospira congkakensis TaxID=2484932 RepID=A0A4Z1AB14_9LEPT|nr:hypothetical protein [Leptospira congkakensis]TGL88790.1 hypothetical protein EHQ69_15210 [Leptospira congkakensis]TGL89376.1 hypothetical protein EHQ68_09140 [Leptospira congkakensis]TGL97344.1 hypothetical protein EHQ70_08635 [Leptospira congkakensis]
MPRFKPLTIVLFIFTFFTCQSTGNYFLNRGADLSDSFTLGVETNHYGAGFWLWCIGGGAHINQNAKGIGIRNGHLGLYKAGGVDDIGIFGGTSNKTFTNQMGNSFLLINSNQHRPIYPDSKRSRQKSYDASNVMMLVFFTDKKNSSGKKHCNQPVSFEVSLGLFLGVRAGFNFSEFSDFLLGFTTYDFMEDDVFESEP